MGREAFWSMVLLIGGGSALAAVQLVRLGEAGTAYVRATERSVSIPAVEGEPARIVGWTEYRNVAVRERGEEGVSLSLPRSAGLWIAALLTLAVFSFLAGDNPAYKLAESVFVGVSAGYAMVAAFWDELVPNLLAKIAPETIRDLGLGNLKGEDVPGLRRFFGAVARFDGGGMSEYVSHLIHLVPVVLSVMMLWQLAPKGGWIARWPLAFFIGATAGIRLYTFFESDFLRQIQQTMLPLVVLVPQEGSRAVDATESFKASLKNATIVVGVLTSLTYFFFSIEHRGPVRVATRTGVYVLMITFGAGFAYTVMGRIALLAERFEFLFIDWLWLIDPLGTRG